MSKILIIEDEEAIADLEKDYLELSGFEVEIANRGDVGLEKALNEDYDLIKEKVTEEKLKDYFKDIVHGKITRYELPTISALNFVLEDALGGGVTRSLAIDMHGKTLGSALLEMEID